MKLAIVVAICSALIGCGMTDAGALHGREKADALVNAYAKHVGAGDAQLDAGNDRSFGDFGFSYDPIRNALTVRVYIVRADLDWGPQAVEAINATVHALNDPKIGGMFERDGGYFFLDRKKQITFLAKSLDVAAMTQHGFNNQVDDLRGLAGIWITQWFAHVADMAHGHEPPPTHKITRQNNPYHP